LTSQLKDESRSRIQKWIRLKLVFVNGLSKKTGYLLEHNDKITVQIPEEPVQTDIPEPIDLDILFEDDQIVVINKPAGLVVHPGISNKSGTLVNGLLFHFNSLSDLNGPSRPGIVHRLDKDTSGVIIIAKTNFSHSSLSNQFQKRTVRKTYSALTWGAWKEKKGKVLQPISRNTKDPTCYIVSNDGKSSQTNFNVQKQFRHLALVSFYPKTGRTHQIRVHSTFLGHPIFGDEKYGGGASRAKGFLPEYTKIYNKKVRELNRHALHAEEIEILHPVKNKNMIFKAPLPIELLNLTKSLETLYEE
jgi:23S rRNA pseudouridine1911/1915/1917 synthase